MKWKEFRATGWGPLPKVTLLSGENKGEEQKDDKLQRASLTEEPNAGIKGEGAPGGPRRRD